MSAPEPEQLISDNMTWAAEYARSIARKLPPSIDVEDVIQQAYIGLWEAAQSFDGSKHVPFRAWAFLKVRGAIFMSIRRKAYREATMDEMPSVITDERASVEDNLIALDAEQQQSDEIRHQREMLQQMLSTMPWCDAYLVRRVYFDGVTAQEIARVWRVEETTINRRVASAVRSLKRATRKVCV